MPFYSCIIIFSKLHFTDTELRTSYPTLRDQVTGKFHAVLKGSCPVLALFTITARTLTGGLPTALVDFSCWGGANIVVNSSATRAASLTELKINRKTHLVVCTSVALPCTLLNMHRTLQCQNHVTDTVSSTPLVLVWVKAASHPCAPGASAVLR